MELGRWAEKPAPRGDAGEAPGVPPGQPTVVSVAGQTDSRSINKQADKNLGLKQRSFIRFLTSGFEFVRPVQNYKAATCTAKGIVQD